MGIMSLAESFDLSIEILKKYIKTIVMFKLGYSIVLFLILLLLCTIGGIFFFISVVLFPNKIVIGIGTALIIIISLALCLSSNIGIIHITHQEFFGEKFYADQAIKVSANSIFKVILLTMVTILAFMPIIGVFLLIIFYLVSILTDASIFTVSHNIERIFLIILTTLVSIAGIFLFLCSSTFLIFSLQAMTIENKGVFEALRRSFKLVKSNFWKTLGSLLLLSLIPFAFRASIESFFMLILGFLYLLLKFLNIHIVYSAFITYSMLYVRWPLTILFWLFVSPFTSIAISVLYFNQRFKTEGYDISLRLKELQNNNERIQVSEGAVINDTN